MYTIIVHQDRYFSDASERVETIIPSIPNTPKPGIKHSIASNTKPMVKQTIQIML